MHECVLGLSCTDRPLLGNSKNPRKSRTQQPDRRNQEGMRWLTRSPSNCTKLGRNEKRYILPICLDCAICQGMDICLVTFRAYTILHSATIMLLVQLVLGAHIISRALVPGVAVHTCFGPTREGHSERPKSEGTWFYMV